MSSRQGLRTLAHNESSIERVRLRATYVLWMSLVGSFLGYVLFFLLLHLEGIGWAPGQVFANVAGYWTGFTRLFWSEELVTAVRSSSLAARFPLWLMLAYVPLGLGYLGMLAALRALPAERQPRLRTLIGAAVVFSIPLLLLPNLLSSDVYSYISFGRIAAVWHGNPFVDSPSRFPADEYLRYVYWIDVPSVYGPPWIYVSMFVTALVEHTWSSPVIYVLLYKIVVAVLHLVNGALLWAVLSRWQPEQRAWRTAFYLLNPLALVEFAGNAHNDVLMITFILLGIWFHLHDLWKWTVVAWTVAVLAKWIALPLLPLYALVILWNNRGLRVWAARLGGMAGLVAATTLLMYAPFWQGPKTLEVLIDAPPQRLMVNSLGDMFAYEVQYSMYLRGRGSHPDQGSWTTIPLLGDATTSSGRTVGGRGIDGVDEEASWRDEQRVLLQRYNRQQQAEHAALIRQDRSLASILRLGGLVLVMLTCLAGAAITRDLRTLLLALAAIFFVYVTVGSVWVWPWYATWFVALAAMLDWRVSGRAAVILSLVVPIIYPLTPILLLPTLAEHLRPLIAFGPAIAFVAYHVVRSSRERWLRWRTRRALGKRELAVNEIV